MEANNAAALREALEELVANIEMRSSAFGLNVMVDTKTFIDAKSALAKPLRNCDVGTIEEQKKRFSEFCASNADPFEIDKWKCGRQCPLYGKCKCEFDWLQMPYKEREESNE